MDRLDILINNAGIGTAGPRQTSAGGFELRFAVNYLASFLLTLLLLNPSLRNASLLRFLSDLPEESPRSPDHRRYLAPISHGFRGIITMPKCVRVADGSAASRGATMHSTPALSAHRGRLARFPTARPRSASGCPVHG